MEIASVKIELSQMCCNLLPRYSLENLELLIAPSWLPFFTQQIMPQAEGFSAQSQACGSLSEGKTKIKVKQLVQSARSSPCIIQDGSPRPGLPDQEEPGWVPIILNTSPPPWGFNGSWQNARQVGKKDRKYTHPNATGVIFRWGHGRDWFLCYSSALRWH